jgi:hypothetical protein
MFLKDKNNLPKKEENALAHHHLTMSVIALKKSAKR